MASPLAIIEVPFACPAIVSQNRNHTSEDILRHVLGFPQGINILYVSIKQALSWVSLWRPTFLIPAADSPHHLY